MVKVNAWGRLLLTCKEIEAHCRVDNPGIGRVAHAQEGKELRQRLKAAVAECEAGREGDNIEICAKSIWLAEFERAFSRTPTDPWENQDERIKYGHRNTARKLVDAGIILP